MISFVYMAKPIYGGWVTFTSHLCLKYDVDLYKVGKRTEKNKRKYGYGVEYQNMTIDDILKQKQLLITAVDKHYWDYLHLFPKGTQLVIHDPTELKGKDNPLLKLLEHFKIITIRKMVQEYIKKNFGIDTEFLYHPFYEYQKSDGNSPYHSLSISRIDFDKHTDIILKANQLIEEKDKHIQIFGAENRLYVHHKLKDLNFETYWHGKFPKTLPITYEGKDLLNGCKYVVDMSIIKGDGGGTQYTFLEAIYHNCVLILHKEWIDKDELFKHEYNCFAVGYTESPEQEIADIINKTDDKCEMIINNAKKLLNNHTKVKWI